MSGLLNDIKKGADSEHFKDPNAQTYLLRLFKDQKITPGEFLSAYNYTMALHDYTNNSSFKPPKLQAFTENNQLTPDGMEYIKIVAEKFKKLVRIDIDQEKLKEKILSLSPFEQLASVLETTYEKGSPYELLNQTLDIVPSYVEKQSEKPYRYFHRKGNMMMPPEDIPLYNWTAAFPSYSLQNYLLETYFKEPMKIAPRFGSIGNESLHKMHINNQHIQPLHHDLVKSSMKKAHDLEEGSFSIAKHDEGHVVLASVLLKEARDKILNHDIPKFKALYEWMKTPESNQTLSNLPVEKEVMIKVLHDIIFDQLNDLTAFPSRQYADLKTADLQRKEMLNKAFYQTTKDRETNNTYLKYLVITFLAANHPDIKEPFYYDTFIRDYMFKDKIIKDAQEKLVDIVLAVKMKREVEEFKKTTPPSSTPTMRR
jgi:hypothetical protein